MSKKFSDFVVWAGGPVEAAKRLGCSESMVRHVLNGRREVSKNLAIRVDEVSEGQFDRASVLFGDESAA